MDDDFFEQYVTDLKRKGDSEKVRLLEGLSKKVLPSQLKKIHNKDKAVLQELFLPKWVSWELLYAWAARYKVPEKGNICVLCSERSGLGIDFKDKFICENCYIRLKQLK